MSAADPLAAYRAKRDFSRTSEPQGASLATEGNGFVVQKHAATRLHYDFRLELDGVLLSWAITRGPSANPADKRLAVRTEDHPLDYATFEGSIPRQEYGGGTVMLWDNGTWEPVPGKDPRQTLADGHLHFFLYGRRMQGEWILVRLKPRAGEKRENWLLRKVADEHAGGSDDLTGRHLTSITTGRSLDEIAAGKPPAQPSNSRPALTKAAKVTPRQARRTGGTAPPPFRPVQLATLADRVPAGEQWLHEVKFDGYRTLIAVGGGQARIYTRSGLDWSDRYAGLIADAGALPVETALIDGEAVVLLPDGRSSFEALQAALKGDPAQIDFFAFDLLELNGKDLADRPLCERKQELAALIGMGRGHIRYSDHIAGQGELLFDRFCAAGLEGVISKLSDAKYVGARTSNWLKTKCTQRQDFLVVGWLPSDARRGFRSLLLARREGDRLVYAGKVGTGFGRDQMERLRELMAPLSIKSAPVKVPGVAARGARWITPALTVEIAFAEMTKQGLVRHASYLGLSDAKRKSATPAAKVPTPAGTGSGIRITNADRVIFPDSGITKGELAAYYESVAKIMLPWLAGRPVSLVRCPQGRAKKCFFQKHDAGSFGDAVHRIPITEKDGETADYLWLDSAAGLLSSVQMGTIEFHGWGSRVKAIEQPDRLVMDLDPDEGLDERRLIDAALHIRDVLADMGLVTFPLQTGGKGLHVVAPLVPSAEWPQVKDFARRLATALASSDPARFTASMAKAGRKGRIFIDWLRNQRGATAVMPYSVRAREAAPVSVPMTWEELRGATTLPHWHIGDAVSIIARAASLDLQHWGRADQLLPDL